jgi:hypothetical protein
MTVCSSPLSICRIHAADISNDNTRLPCNAAAAQLSALSLVIQGCLRPLCLHLSEIWVSPLKLLETSRRISCTLLNDFVWTLESRKKGGRVGFSHILEVRDFQLPGMTATCCLPFLVCSLRGEARDQAATPALIPTWSLSRSPRLVAIVVCLLSAMGV